MKYLLKSIQIIGDLIVATYERPDKTLFTVHIEPDALGSVCVHGELSPTDSTPLPTLSQDFQLAPNCRISNALVYIS